MVKKRNSNEIFVRQMALCHDALDSSILQTGVESPLPTSDLLHKMAVANNEVAGVKSIFKFGFNSDVNGTEETIWDQGGIYSYPTSAIQIKVSSTSANDAAAGTGARTMTVVGLDGNYNEAQETVSLNGQTEVLTDTTFIRVFRAFVETAGSSGTAAGDIYMGNGVVSGGVPATVYAKISLGENQTLMALWTVPAGYTGYLTKIDLGTGTPNNNQYINARIIQRAFGGVFRTATKITLQTGGNILNFPAPIVLPEKTDIEARAVSSGSSNLIFANMFIVYKFN